VLHDELGIGAEIGVVADPESPARPDAAAFDELTSDFWYHALWIARKLRRGEVYTAVGGLARLLLSNLVTLLRWHATSVDPSLDTWHGTRFVERWADPGALAALETAFPHYAVRDVAHALWETIDVFQGLEEETARRLGLSSVVDHVEMRRLVSGVVRDPRPGATLWP
jgi:aminoglycoside 6-adenylyltransferase